MSYRIESNERVEDAVRRVATEQLDKALAEIDSETLDVHKKVHQVRKRCKKLRGLIRLTRPAFEDTYNSENRCFRDAARELSEYRDAKSIIGTYDDVLDHFDDQVDRTAFASVRGQLTRRLNAIDEERIAETLDSVGQQLKSAADRVCRWQLSDHGFDAIAKGLSKTRQRAVNRLKDVRDDPNTETLHQWRKRVKYHWYHLRLLRPLWPPVMKVLAKQANELGGILGDDHDLAVFEATITAEKANFGSETDIKALCGLLGERRDELQKRAFRLGQRLFAESNSCFRHRTHEYWRTR